MKLLLALSKLPYHRSRHGRDYSLSSILGVVILGKLCGRKSLASICRFAKSGREITEALETFADNKNLAMKLII